MSDAFILWFFRIWGTVLVVNVTLWLWKHFPFGLVIIAVATLMVRRAVATEREQLRIQGYWVEYVSPGVLRAGEDDFAVVYHEGDRQHFFDGKLSRNSTPDILHVPSQSAWRHRTPEWIREKRPLILERVRQELKKRPRSRQIQIVETDASENASQL